MALIVRVDGSRETFDGMMSLDQMRGVVGGSIEHVSICLEIDGEFYRHLIVNEEGKLIGLPLNVFASSLIGWADEIAGNAIFMKAGEIE